MLAFGFMFNSDLKLAFGFMFKLDLIMVLFGFVFVLTIVRSDSCSFMSDSYAQTWICVPF